MQTRLIALFAFVVCIVNSLSAVDDPLTSRDINKVPLGTPAQMVNSEAVTVKITTYAYAGNNQTVRTSLSDASGSILGLGVDTEVTSSTLYAHLRPYAGYTLKVGGPDLLQTYVTIEVIDPPTLLISKAAEDRVPQSFWAYANGVRVMSPLEYYNADYYQNSGDPNEPPIPGKTNIWNIVLHEKRNPQMLSMDDCDWAEKYAGDAEWVKVTSAKNGEISEASIYWCANLGALGDGRDAGRIYMLAKAMNTNAYTPVLLNYESKAPNTAQSLSFTTNNGFLQEIVAPQSKVQVVTNSNGLGYEVRFTLPSGGSPFVVYQFDNPDQSPTNCTRLRIREIRNGQTNTSEVAYGTNGTSRTWTTTYGQGSEKRVETRIVTISGGYRQETVTLKYDNDSWQYQFRETYEQESWGWELTEYVVDPSGSQMTTSYEYDSVGRLTAVRYPQGMWEKRIYDDGFSYWYLLQPQQDGPTDPAFADVNNSHCTHYFYNTGSLIPSSYEYAFGMLEQFVRHDVNEFIETAEYDLCSVRICDPNRTDRTVSMVETHRYPSTDTSGMANHLQYRGKSSQPSEYFDYAAGWYSFDSHTFLNTQPTSGNYSSAFMRTKDKQSICKEGEISYLVPTQSTREVSIYSVGMLVQEEHYVYNSAGQFELVNYFWHQYDTLGHRTNSIRVDATSSASRIVYQANYKGGDGNDGAFLRSQVNDTGIETAYTYDSLKRVKTVTRKGVAAYGNYAAQGDVITTNYYNVLNNITGQSLAGGGLLITNGATYYQDGRLWQIIQTNGVSVTHTYNDNNRTTTQQWPGGETKVVTLFRDGRVKSVTGSAVVAETYQYTGWTGAGDSVQSRDVFYGSGGLNSARKYRSSMDAAGRDTTVEYPNSLNGIVTVHTEYMLGHFDLPLYCITNDILGVTYNYDAMGLEKRRGVMIEGVNYDDIPLDGLNRITDTDTYFVKIGGHWWQQTDKSIYLTDNSAGRTQIHSVRERISGFTASTLGQVVEIDQNQLQTITTTTVDRDNKLITKTVDTPDSTLDAVEISRNGLVQSSSTATVAKATTYRYDAIGRPVATINPLGFTTSITYDAFTKEVKTITDGRGAQTVNEYYPANEAVAGRAGKLRSVLNAAGHFTYYDYNARGQLTRTWGDVPYPEERVYDEYGALYQLKTYRGGSGWNGSTWPTNPGEADVTQWNYHPASGLLISKTDAQGQSVAYEYDEYNRPTVTRWARGESRTIGYDGVDVNFIDLSDTTTNPDVQFTDYNRQGLPRTIADPTGSHTLAYDSIGRWLTDTCGGLTVANHYDPAYGKDTVTASGPSWSYSCQYSFDTNGRIYGIGNGPLYSIHQYQANADWAEKVVLGGPIIMEVSRIRGGDGRLERISQTVGENIISQHGYIYDSLNRRTRATLADSSTWDYNYNDRDELLGAKRCWSDFTPVTGQRFKYNYDNIGNRLTSWAGGDANGDNLRPTVYVPDSLNRYTSITTTNYEDVWGVAYATTTVTVNGQSTDRKGEYFHAELSLGNNINPLWVNVTTAPAFSGDSHLLVPPANVTPTYDLDGNLLNDGLWSYVWDAENRLKQMSSLTTVDTAARRKIVFTYDYMGRRATKQVYLWSGLDWATTPATRLRYLYDGWNLVAELNASNNTLVRSYIWGQDLSGSFDAAGGIGGLLFITDHTTGSSYIPAYDGNGNIMALVHTTTGSVAAQYEYSPFGELIRSTGTMAKANPFRWSTKYWDEETGLVYYGYRYYSPAMGRWINRDLSGERGGNNLYLFVGNNPLNMVDVKGLWGVQFGGFNVGVGNPNLAFDTGSWGDAGKGLCAVIDGIVPFGNPFASSGAYDQNDPVLVASRQLGTFARDLLCVTALPNLSVWAKNPVLYEIGQKTMATEVYNTMKNMDALSRASRLIGSAGFLNAFVPSLNPALYLKTIGTGLTPGAWMLVGGIAEAVDQFYLGE